MKVYFATTNSLKFDIARKYFSRIDDVYELVQLEVEPPEIQSTSVEEIARHAAVAAAQSTGAPCIKMDVGFSIEALNGFPGPFVKYVNDMLGVREYLRLMDGVENRNAHFVDVTAIGYPDGSSVAFERKEAGTLALDGDTDDPWPANALFMPSGHDRPLGSLSREEQLDFWGDGNWPAVINHLSA